MGRWADLSDEQLAARLEREKRNLHCIDKKVRVIAKRLIKEIEDEQARRYEKSWGLD